LEVVAASPPVLYVVDAADSNPSRRELAVDGLILAARRTAAGWYLLTESAVSGAVTIGVHGLPGRGAVGTYAAITPVEGGVWLTALTYPFEAQLFDDAWTRRMALRPPEAVLDSMRVAAGHSDFGLWASLPLVRLENGYLQTIADMAEDRRLFVPYDESGQAAASMAVDVPLGLLLGTNGFIYGARRTDRLEIVRYSYTWGSLER
jgi:hypothetical protein